MKAAILSLILLAGLWAGPPARAEDVPPACDVPAYMLSSESTLAKVAAAVKGGKPLNVLVVGSRSSTIAQQDASAYPARLLAMLKDKLGTLARQSLRRNTERQDRRGGRRHPRQAGGSKKPYFGHLADRHRTMLSGASIPMISAMPSTKGLLRCKRRESMWFW